VALPNMQASVNADPAPIEQRSHLPFSLVFLGLSCLAAGLALAYRFLPLSDWPQTCLQASILRHFDDPSFRFRDYYTIDAWFVPYQGFRYLQVWLSAALGDALGMRAAMLVYLVGMPCAFLALAVRCGLDAWRSLGAFSILVEANFLWGFGAHVMAVTLLLTALVATLGMITVGSRFWSLAHLLLGVALFFTHPIVTAVWCVTSSVVLLFAWRRGQLTHRQLWEGAATIAPGAGCLGYYLISRGWIDGSVLQDQGNWSYGAGIVWRSPLTALLRLPQDTGLAGLAPGAFLAFLLAVVGAQIVGSHSERERERSPVLRAVPWLLAGTWAALWLALPDGARGERMAPRMASLIGLSALLLPAFRVSAVRRVPLLVGRALLVGSALYLLTNVHARFTTANRELAPIARLAAKVPMGSKVAFISYSDKSKAFKQPIFEHAGAHITVMRGGLTSLMFTRLGINYAPSINRSDLMLAPPTRPSGSQLKHGWTLPQNVADAFDYVFVRKGKGYPGRPIAPEDARTRLIGRGGSLQLWKIEH